MKDGLKTDQNIREGMLKNLWRLSLWCIADRRLPAPVISLYRRVFSRPFHQNQRNIALEITTACNIGCDQCNRSCGVQQAPSNEHMDLAQIDRFIEHSIGQTRKWRQIVVAGGEPTLHPEFATILSRLRNYRDNYSRNSRIVVVSNGHGAHVQKILATIPSDIIITNTNKTTPEKKGHASYNIAPRDVTFFQNKNFCEGCIVIEVCGMGLTRYGYYTCGPGASVDRVFGFRLGILNLADATPNRLREQRRLLCSYCGHFKDWGLHKCQTCEREQDHGAISCSWKTAYEGYRKKPPVLETM
jgi:hypothetical protein